MSTSNSLRAIFAFVLIVFFFQFSFAQKSASDFVFTINTARPGVSNSSSYSLETHPFSSYNYDIDWNNDGIFDSLGLVGSIVLTYTTPGVYTIRIRGQFPAIRFGEFYNFNTNRRFPRDERKFLRIDQWGSQQWTDFKRAFYNCDSVSLPLDTPNFSQLTTTESMFYGVSTFNSSIDHWDMSNVQNTSSMFAFASSFNQPLNNWDVSSVTDMNNMFAAASLFNQPLNNWDVSSVIDMSGLFGSASSFNQPLNSWDVSSVISMSGTFSGAASFNQPLDNWDVSSVMAMDVMFGDAISFNQPLNSWDMSSDTSLTYMFSNASSFNQPLNNWNVSNVKRFIGMFEKAALFNQNINSWNVSSGESFNDMFKDAPVFNQPLNNWNTISAFNMVGMFDGAYSFNQPLNNWNVINCREMSSMFHHASSFDQALHYWNFHQFTNFSLFLDSSNLSISNYDSLLIKLMNSPFLNSRGMGVKFLEYCNGRNARDSLINLGWSFFLDSLNCQIVELDEFELDFSVFLLYPNPASNQINLEVDKTQIGERLQLFNLQGKLIAERIVFEEKLQIELHDYPDGLYFLRVGENTQKLIIQH